MVKPDTYKVRLTFIEDLLGTVPLNEDLFRDYIQSKHPKAEGDDELETLTVDEEMVKGMTGFHRTPDMTPLLYDYVIKGFFKDACGMLNRVPNKGRKKLAAYKKVIDGLIFVEPRQIEIDIVGDEDKCERPLRAQTPKGERVALAVSQSIPAGSSIAFAVMVLGVVSKPRLEEWLTYGQLRGLGQWRNSGKGRFTYELTEA